MMPEVMISKQVWKIGDCLKLLREMPSSSIDLVITDPPYNLGKDYGETTNDNLSEEEYWGWFKEVFAEVYRVMNIGYLYISHSDKGVYSAKHILEEIGWEYLQTLIWYGKNGYSMQRKRKTWSFRHEPILFMQKGDPAPLNDGKPGMWYTSVLEVPRPQSNFKEGRYHPTQKPLMLYQLLIQRTPCTTVFDPFVGSGTTLLACRNLNKDGIGFEINPDYEGIIRKRIMADISPLETWALKEAVA